MKIRRDTTGHAYRYVPTKKINTVYGTESINRIRCNSCGEVKNQSSYYHTKGIPFKKCVKCDDERRKLDAKIKRRKNKGIYVNKNLDTIPNLEDLGLL